MSSPRFRLKPRHLSKDIIWEEQTPASGLYFKVKKWLHRQQSRFHRIEVIENETYGRVLLLDGLVQTTEADEFFYHEMLVQPALHCHPEPERVLIIGGGDGGALKEVLKHPVKKVIMVEIDERVIEVGRKFFPWLESCLKDERAEIILADGNDYITTTKEKFDIILVDSSDPIGPSEILHRQEFFLKLKKIMRPRAIIAAQSGSVFFQRESIRQKRHFLEAMFYYTHFYLSPMPTYPGGLWCYAFLSDRINPLRGPAKKVIPGLKYYSRAIHRAAFVLPPFL